MESQRAEGVGAANERTGRGASDKELAKRPLEPGAGRELDLEAEAEVEAGGGGSRSGSKSVRPIESGQASSCQG